MKKIYRQNLLLFILITLLLSLSIISVNYYGDAGYYFHRSQQFEDNLVNNLLNNNKALICVNYNDRSVKKSLINQLSSPSDTLIIGSSRTLPITKIFSEHKSLLNGSVTGAGLEDDLAIYYLYQRKGWQPKKILINLDPWILNNSKITWKTTFLSEFSHAQKLFFNEHHSSVNFLQKINGFFEKYTALISFSYFRESLKNMPFLTHASQNIFINPTIQQIALHPSCYLYLPEGTRLTSQTEEATSIDQADDAGVLEMHKWLPETREMSANKKMLFESFINYLLQKNINVIFYLPPYEPMAYQEIKKDKNNQIIQAENYFRAIATKHHIKMIGSYNPTILNLSSTDFIDEIHLKKQGIEKIFSSHDL